MAIGWDKASQLARYGVLGSNARPSAAARDWRAALSAHGRPWVERWLGSEAARRHRRVPHRLRITLAAMAWPPRTRVHGASIPAISSLDLLRSARDCVSSIGNWLRMQHPSASGRVPLLYGGSGRASRGDRALSRSGEVAVLAGRGYRRRSHTVSWRRSRSGVRPRTSWPTAFNRSASCVESGALGGDWQASWATSPEVRRWRAPACAPR
jgi:hypothetical protein